MARQQAPHSWSVVKEDNVKAGLQAENLILTQYHGIINERQNHPPITGEMEAKLRENLLVQLKIAATQQELQIVYFSVDPVYFGSMYACIQLRTDHGPKDILAEVSNVEGIVKVCLPMKTQIFIRPDGKTVDVYQNSQPDVNLNGKPDVQLKVAAPIAKLA